jgi:hypothetical protein
VSLALRLLMASTIALACASCGTGSSGPPDAGQADAATGESTSSTTESVAPTASPSGSAAPRADVAWNDRVDFEIWAAPSPSGQEEWPTEPPSRWPDIRVRLVLPPAVAAGEVVDYIVVLRNLSGDPMDLSPCGGYEQEVKRLGSGYTAQAVKGGTSSFRLNCDADPTLMPSESRRYAMRLVVPEGVTGKEVLFRWGFVDNMPDYEAQSWVELSPPS